MLIGVFKRTKEHNEKLIKALYPYRFKKGHIPWDTNLKLTEEHKQKIKDTHADFKNEKHPNWKGGRTKFPEMIRECQKEYYRKNKAKINKYNKARYYKRRGAGELLVKTIQLVYEDNIKRYGTLTCIYCLNPIEFGQDSLEHKIPINRNGTNEYNNLAIACRSCNSSKQDKTLEEFIKRRK